VSGTTLPFAVEPIPEAERRPGGPTHRRAGAALPRVAEAQPVPRAGSAAATPRRRADGTQAEREAADLLARMGLEIVATQHAVSLAAGPRYTADLLVRGRDGREYLAEIKGYRHHSAQRSRLAFLCAVRETGMGGLWVERRAAERGAPTLWRIEVFGARGL